ncbi:MULTISPECIES: extracellular solute-binding protein [unclassified Streptomyces]|uniref:extracellular solute-binding protein n=1 Tax=unclassified Streptomyces TaxID=2593676 RepID=UPI00081DBDB0|nr:MULTISPECIES: extracellular solute-binding protein [unclassified Streptomyces]MYR28553.1 extracellular solute-binding protein [Streptomyces sp. SID4945]SCF38989.1 carbohydrate ABC transporter substrate-binding protein, CUT1 family [Streptomyces sp. LcepLS]
MSRTPRRTPRTAHRARRIALLTTATATATALLAACGGDGGGSAAKDSSGRLVLTEMDYYNTDPTMSALPKLLDSCGRKAGVTVRRKIVPDLRTKLIQLAGSHAVPDLVLLDNPDLQQLAATGALTDLGAAGLRTEGLYENVVAAGQYEGKLYGVAPGVNSLALFYDKKLLTDAGLTPPTTWDALGKAAKKLTSGKRHGLGFAVPATEEGSFQFESFFLSAGAELSKLDSPEAVRALTFLDTLVKEGAAPKDVLSWTQANVQEQFANGSLGMMVNGPWQLPQLRKAGMSEADYGVVPMPVPAKGGTPSGALGGEVWAAGNNGAEKSRKAAEVISCMVNEKNSLTWSKLTQYVPAAKSAAAELAAEQPQMKPFVDGIAGARGRTAKLGATYPAASQALWTAVQAALSGQKSPSAALAAAQAEASR